MKKKKISVIPTFHHDIAYLKPEKDYYYKATEILNKACELMEKDENYTFTVEQSYFFERYWNENPEKHDILKKFFVNGQLNFAPGMWVVPDMCMPSGESIYMQSTYGRRALEKIFGDTSKRVLTGYIADCWGHHSTLPEIMTQCGYKYYVFSRCMEKNFDKENFIWEGIDKSRIYGHWMSTSYAGLEFKDSVAKVNAEELSWSSATKEGVLSLYNRNRVRCGDAHQIMPAGGDMKMPADSALDAMKNLQNEADIPGIGFSSFEKALAEIDYSRKPVYSGEFISSMKGSFATNIGIKHYNNKMEQDLYGLEVLSVMKKRNIGFDKQWKTTLKNQFHDIICGTICDEALEQTMAEYKEATEEMEEKRVQLSPKGEKAFFNALPFAVSEVSEDGNTAFKAEAFSYAKTRDIEKSEIKLPCEFENEYYKAKIDDKGYISSLIEKKSRKEIVSVKEAKFGILQMQADNGDNWVEFEYPSEYELSKYSTNFTDPYNRKNLPVHKNVALSAGGVYEVKAERLGEDGIRVTQKGNLRYWVTEFPFTSTVTLYKGSPRIDYHTEFDCKSPHIRVRVAFPTNLNGGMIRHQIPYAVVRRSEGPQPLSMFMDCQKDGCGVSLINKGNPANNTEDGIMMMTIFRSVAMEYKCQSTQSYNIGNHIATDYAILPHGCDDEIKLWQNALSFNRRLIETTVEPLCNILVKDAFVSAMRYDGDDLFMRVYSGVDIDTEAKITIHNEYKYYAYTDGLMNPVTEKMAVIGGEVRMGLSPYKVLGIKFFK